MRKAFANLLIADVQLIKNNEVKFTKGKVMFTEGNQALSINKQLSTEQGNAVANNGINVTHYYIKFIPRNDADYSLLKMDSNLIIYPFPLDNDVSPYSGSYRDPAVATGVPTYQYAAVPISYNLPNVPYVKLEDLYLPDEQNKNSLVTVNGAGGSSFTVSVEQLVNQALCDGGGPIDPPTYSKTITKDNVVKSSAYKPPVVSVVPVDDPEPCDEEGGGGSYPPGDPYSNGESWRPNGRITLDDDIKGTIGVEGIKVRARRWFTTYTGITDENGYYAVDGWYTRPANYWLEFERYDFSVNNHSGGPREISGPKQEAPWNYHLEGYDKFVGTIFRAAIHYYYKDIQGLRRPPLNSFWATQMKIGAFDETGGSNGDHNAGRRFLGLGEAIHIYRPERSSSAIYATTIHELAHAVHWETATSDYNNADLNVVESWAPGVQWVLTKMEYPTYFGREDYPPSNYTNVIMDMIDTESDRFFNVGFFGTQDQVTGYTIVQIQDALVGARTFNEWKNNIKNNYDNPTEQHLDALFNAWLGI
jgi:hypothetical protein